MTEGDRPGPAGRPRLLQSQQSTIRLRRPSTTGRPRRPSEPPLNPDVSPQRPTPARRRAATVGAEDTIGDIGGAPTRPRESNQIREPSVLAPISSDVPRESEEEEEKSEDTAEGEENNGRRGMLARFRWRSDTNLQASAQAGERAEGREDVDEHEYNDQIVNLLDAIDPEVTTLSSLTNVQNSLYAPPLGKWINRRPAYNLTRLRRPRTEAPPVPSDVPESPPAPSPASEPTQPPSREEAQPASPVERIPSNMEDGFFAVRPQGISFADWSDEDLAELNDHVRHMLHSRQSAMHRRLKAFGQYVRRPLGFLITLYATLITLFGLAWVLFLIGWIYVGSKQLYVINVIDNVLVALFAIVGDGMIPWRLVDTYHMGHIARYHRLTWKLRGRMAVPRLRDKNDLPSETVRDETADVDLEAALNSAEKEVSVLTPRQQAALEHHQQKFAKSHTFYKPHETETHYAFPLRLLITIVCLLDLHSCLQLALGLTTWIIDYRVRPAAVTAVILTCSICVNTLAGVLIMVGDRRTRKKDVVERIFRQDLTKEAMRRVRKRQKEERKKEERKEEKRARKSLAADGEAGRPSLSLFRRSEDKEGTESPRQKSFLNFRKSEDKGTESPRRNSLPRQKSFLNFRKSEDKGTESPRRNSLPRLRRSADKERGEETPRTSFSRLGRLGEKASKSGSKVPSEERRVEE